MDVRTNWKRVQVERGCQGPTPCRPRTQGGKLYKVDRGADLSNEISMELNDMRSDDLTWGDGCDCHPLDSFDGYQEMACWTRRYGGPDGGELPCYAMGVSGETGEIVEVLKKWWRTGAGDIPERVKDVLEEEIGDLLWYLAVMSDHLGLSLSGIEKRNARKLRGRDKAGTIISENREE